MTNATPRRRHAQTVEGPLDRIPVFGRGGRIIPMLAAPPQTTDNLRPESVELHVMLPAEDGEFQSMLHADDGLTTAVLRGDFLRTTFTLRKHGSRLQIDAKISGQGFPEFARREFRLVFHGGTVDRLSAGERELPLKENSVALPNQGTAFSLHGVLRA